MTQIERIQHMERVLDEADTVVQSLHDTLEIYRALLPRIRKLEAYYTGEQWRQDYEDDCAGRLPSELKRGVLSQDAVYNLLTNEAEMLTVMREVLSSKETEE